MTYQYRPTDYRYRPTPKARIFAGHDDLAQHPELSLMAIGVGVHLRMLPEGAPTSVQALASQLRDSEFEIAAALQELKDHGFLPKA
ncbi:MULTISPECIES: hypothetical protein [unclassified Streptomyces]|uniref:hypothetical protein n=1 Tax=unclassified Streptomyces TaxID=2593676 RepID=UPI0011A9CDA9|nr:hypothetical protein [Streptomyces sp. BK340]TVZ97883.1 hypothetical protein FB157_102341 [Streptomyces sp. BK340]